MTDRNDGTPYHLQRNTVNIFGEINTAMSLDVISQIQYLDDNGAEEIIVQINSPGGEVPAGLAIYDTMNYSKARIVTVGVGMCASMAAVLLSSGSKGYRRATEHCEIMIHQPLGGAREAQASDLILKAEHIRRTRDTLNGILAANSGKTIETLAKDTDRDNCMTAQEAMEYGLIDTVIRSRNKATGE